ncbi:hypothetical protein TrRE_jg2884 [Triparma retinervis]|uniref:Sulfotransferase domain-containing protein n=1 Tax=Triparma retinervis TaxID=2557542 RepID=A0A9W7A1R0_9STRA|nr:hypothetical protein TrRE_jg2884 [Triparma retinervis]
MIDSLQTEVERAKPKKKNKRRRLSGPSSSKPPPAAEVGASHFEQHSLEGPSSGDDMPSHHPPQHPSSPAKVNFLVIGMQKAGTSWIYKMFEDHPSIALSKEKEVHYWDMHFKKDDSWYESQFPDDTQGKVVGEVTPDYLSMWMEKVGKIHSYNPKMKLIVIVRDEIDRAWSAFLMWCRIEGKDVTAMSEDEVFESLTNEYYQSRSDLAGGLQNYLQKFSKKQIFVADFKDVSRRPQELMNEVFQFLGVPELAIQEEKLSKNYQITTDRTAVLENVRHTAPEGLKEKLASRLKAFYKPIVKANKAALKSFREV